MTAGASPRTRRAQTREDRVALGVDAAMTERRRETAAKIDQERVGGFLGPGNEALAAAVVALAEYTRAEIVFAQSLQSRTLTVRTSLSRILPAGRSRRKPSRVLLRLSEVLSALGNAGITGAWVPVPPQKAAE